jgi:hypothetical protein
MINTLFNEMENKERILLEKERNEQLIQEVDLLK